ncbi:hypothetical protein M407DRAFT_16396 [Tulasnella calospora MUT 4182]|uniref:Chaperone DnaJ C-terminal domain-containing protein n=1 Tax=Tulasnella calospora MUT 4182 TaxID=1051891 RepID=A0A0C3Q254_9AGAM|nr:hypothetical protein M407DRAFT_16396 [Tulasnella calospora MUT 4182]
MPGMNMPQEVVRPLKLTLEELRTGTTKKLKIGRKLLNGKQEERVVEVNVLPGWKAGTKAKFDGAGNENEDGTFQTVAFVVEEKPHDGFTREGDDLHAKVRLPLVDALCGPSKPPTITGLDGKTHTVPLPSGVIKPNTPTRIKGEGMPKRKEGKVVGKGDLVVDWDIVFPDRLAPGQKEAIRRGLGA